MSCMYLGSFSIFLVSMFHFFSQKIYGSNVLNVHDRHWLTQEVAAKTKVSQCSLILAIWNVNINVKNIAIVIQSYQKVLITAVNRQWDFCGCLWCRWVMFDFMNTSVIIAYNPFLFRWYHFYYQVVEHATGSTIRQLICNFSTKIDIIALAIIVTIAFSIIIALHKDKHFWILAPFES